MSAADIASDKLRVIARWTPDARTRLQEAALALLDEHGYEATTAAQIAARAGLTERTFFRHFADKREVLFANEDAMQAALVAGVHAAPAAAGATPAGLVRAGLLAVAENLQPRHADLRRRAALIATHPALQERELIKQAATATALAGALRERGVAAGAADVHAEVAIAVLRVAFDRWIAQPARRRRPTLAERVAEALEQLAPAAA
jgi:AcrR family transcriptional regulator